MPKPVLEKLVKFRPQIRLHYEILGTWDTSIALVDLRNNPSLVSLAVTLSNGHFEAFAELQSTAHSCPNLKELSIAIKSHDDEPGPQWQSIPGKCLHLSTLLLDGCCSRDTGVTNLAAMTDMSKLRSLSILNVSVLPALSCEELRSLQIAYSDLWIDDDSDLDEVIKFLYRCNSIEELDISGSMACMGAEILQHLGKSLKVLRFHEYESTSGPHIRRIPSDTRIEALGVQCSNLDTLGIDIDYDGQWVC